MLAHDAPFMPPGLGRARRAITATTAVTAADHGIVIDGTSGTYDVTTGAAASTFGSGFSFGLYNSGTGALTWNPNGAETTRTPAGTVTTLTLLQGQGIFLQTDGTNWEAILTMGLSGSGGATTDNAVARYDGTSGALQNSGVIVDDTNNVSGVVNLTTTGKTSLGAGNAVNAAFSHNIDTNSGQTGATQALLNLAGSSLGTNTTLRGTSIVLTTDNTTKTVTSMVGHNVSPFTKGANDTVTRIGCYQARQQTVGGTANFGFVYNTTTALPTVSGTYAWYNDSVDNEYHGTGVNTFAGSTASTSATTGTVVVTGGVGVSGRLWLGNNEFRHALTAPQHYWTETDASADNKTWAVVVNGEVWKLRIFNDAENSVSDVLSVTRSTTTVGTITIGGATTQATNWAQTGATTISTGTGQASLNGNVVVASGKTITASSGIIFANETLSTYDEGTFTPTIFGSGTAGTPTYTVQVGRYVRVGNKVSCEVYVAISAKTGIAGNIRVGGLPFTIKNTSNYNASSSVGEYGGITFAAGRTQLTPSGGGNTTYIGLTCCGSAVAVTNITDADIAASTYVIIAIEYEI